MRIAKQSEAQQWRQGRVDSRPEPEQAGWAIESRHAAFNYLRIHTTDAEHCAHPANVVVVYSVDATAAKFIEGGGSIVRPKLLIPGIGALIACRDTIGQVFTFLEQERSTP